jgi:hypothetical protein
MSYNFHWIESYCKLWSLSWLGALCVCVKKEKKWGKEGGGGRKIVERE